MPNDHHQRLEYSVSFLRLCDDATFIENIFSDEAHFNLTGHVNRHNSRIWSDENPRVIQERPLHCPRVIVCCGISASRVHGPCFFENYNVTVTVTGERYRSMIRVSYSRTWETKCSQHMVSTGWSPRTYGKRNDGIVKRLLSTSFDFTIWWHSLAPRSPDLTPCDFSLWGYHKSRVYVTNPTNLQELGNNIYHEIAELSPDTLMKIMETTKKRALICQRNQGGHLKDIIFKT